MEHLADMLRDDGLEVLALLGGIVVAVVTFLLSFQTVKVKLDLLIATLKSFATTNHDDHKLITDKLDNHGERIATLEERCDD